MYKKEEFYFESRDNSSKIHAVMWIPEDKPRCIFQIIHGMAEYIERYDEFAQFLTEKGILVVGEDHLGHGKSVAQGGALGYFCEQDAATVVVRDAHRLKKLTQEKYPGVPYCILGHSMGSFILRNYLQRYGSGIQAAIIMGSGMPSKASLLAGKAVAGIQKAVKGSKHPSTLLNHIAFGGCNRKIADRKTVMDWLSRDEAVVNSYNEDQLCGFTFTVNGFFTLFELAWRMYAKEGLAAMPKELPILFLSGTADPIGNYGKGVKSACLSFIHAGMTHVQMKLYDGARHEILNETNRQQVYDDLYQWLKSAIW